MGWIEKFTVQLTTKQRQHMLADEQRQILRNSMLPSSPNAPLHKIRHQMGLRSSSERVSKKAALGVLGLGLPSERQIILEGLRDERSWPQIAREVKRRTWLRWNAAALERLAIKHLYASLGAGSRAEALRAGLERKMVTIQQPYPPAAVILSWL